MEDQTRKASAQKRKDQEKIRFLENKVSEYETYNLEHKQSIEAPAGNLDSIIQMLENEFGTPIDPRPHYTQPSTYKKSYAGDHHVSRNKKERDEFHDTKNHLSIYDEHEGMPTKIEKGYDQLKSDVLDRKKANTSIDTPRYVSVPGAGINVYDIPPPTLNENFVSRGRVQARPKDIHLSRNINFLSPIQFREDKKCKMYKLAGHKL